jgi:dynein heavy chain
MIEAIQQFVTEQLGQKFIETPPFEIAKCYEDSATYTPLMFILAPGANPTEEIFALASKMQMQKKTFSISLGQDQGPEAEKMINTAIDRGYWVILQNCHLDCKWLTNSLDKIIREFPTDRSHHNFRLWLTSRPAQDFPVGLLQKCVKMTAEAPKGIKASMKRSLYKIGKERIDGNSDKNWSKILFGLCFFNAVVQERIKFGPLGWTKNYEFNESDLMVSLRQIELTLNGTDPKGSVSTSQMEAIQYLVGECLYGGRVTDDRDRKCMNYMLLDYLAQHTTAPNTTSSPTSYALPESEGFAAMLETINNYPVNDLPYVCGMHENADITYANNETQRLFSTIISMQPIQKEEAFKIEEEKVAQTLQGKARFYWRFCWRLDWSGCRN